MKLAEKYVLVPDCDDDRWDWTVDKFVNPNHLAAQARVYGTGKTWNENGSVRVCLHSDAIGGWYPPYTLVLDKGIRTPVSVEHKVGMNLKRFRAGIHAIWWKDNDGTHRIDIWGADDTFSSKNGMSEKLASNIWAKIQDHVTIKTLWSLGFK